MIHVEGMDAVRQAAADAELRALAHEPAPKRNNGRIPKRDKAAWFAAMREKARREEMRGKRRSA